MWYVVFCSIPIVERLMTMLMIQETKAVSLFHPNQFQLNSLDFAVLLSLILQANFNCKKPRLATKIYGLRLCLDYTPVTKYLAWLRTMHSALSLSYTYLLRANSILHTCTHIPTTRALYRLLFSSHNQITHVCKI